jgi:NADH-quinone oxidoreductase subunit E
MSKGNRFKEKPDMKVIDAVVEKYRSQPGAMIAILQDIQSTYGYVSTESISRVSAGTGVPTSEIYGIVTFYAQFRMKPQGENLIKVCHGTACHLNGAEQIADSVCKCVGAKEGETSPDNKFTVEKVACLGCCSLAPTIMINDEAYGRLNPDRVRKVIKEFLEAENASTTEAVK